jgi:DNA-binding MurR/RpiR family transcriptional regulator
MNTEPKRATFEQALRGYDEQFRRELADAIVEAIAKASHCDGVTARVIRVHETADAVVDALITVLALSPNLAVPSELRKAADALRERLRREVPVAREQGIPKIIDAACEGNA